MNTTRVDAIESLLVDIDKLEEVTLNKLQTLRELRKTLDTERLRLIVKPDKATPAPVPGPQQQDFFAGLEGIGHLPLERCIYHVLQEQPQGEHTTRSLTYVLGRTNKFKKVSFKKLRRMIQEALRNMRDSASNYAPHMTWNQDPRCGGGTVYTYKWRHPHDKHQRSNRLCMPQVQS